MYEPRPDDAVLAMSTYRNSTDEPPAGARSFEASAVGRWGGWLKLPLVAGAGLGAMTLAALALADGSWRLGGGVMLVGLLVCYAAFDLFMGLRARPRVWIFGDRVRVRVARAPQTVLPEQIDGGQRMIDLTLGLDEIIAMCASDETSSSGQQQLVLDTRDAKVVIGGIGEVSRLHVALLDAIAEHKGTRSTLRTAKASAARQRFDPAIVLRLDTSIRLWVGLATVATSLGVVAAVCGVSPTQPVGTWSLFAALLLSCGSVFAFMHWRRRVLQSWLELSPTTLRIGRGPAHARSFEWAKLRSVYTEVSVSGVSQSTTGVRVGFTNGDELNLDSGYRRADGTRLSDAQLRELLDIGTLRDA